jgi:DNA-binding GntR family transcriptional regulator
MRRSVSSGRDRAVTETASSAGTPDTSGRALVDELAQRIQLQIMSGKLPLGVRLRQETLAEEFGVSRTPVREALRQLQAKGMLEILPRRGAAVRGPSPRDIREAYVVRAELEGLAAELAAELITDAELGQLREAAALFTQAVAHFTMRSDGAGNISDAEWPAANDQFHEVVLRASGNARLYETVQHLHLGFPRNLTWSALSKSSRLLEENATEHDKILRAIEERQPAPARRQMQRHIARAGELVAARYERSRGP